MKTDPRFTWGDLVRVVDDAPADMRPGALADVVGFREGAVGVLYTIEFGDGSDSEVSEEFLCPRAEAS